MLLLTHCVSYNKEIRTVDNSKIMTVVSPLTLGICIGSEEEVIAPSTCPLNFLTDKYTKKYQATDVSSFIYLYSYSLESSMRSDSAKLVCQM